MIQYYSSRSKLGSKPKFWFKYQGENWLFKEARENTGEDWSEKVASEIASLLGLPAHHADLAVWEGRRGCAVKSFVKSNIMFHEWAVGAALATSIAHRGGLAGAMALAGTVIDLFSEPGLVDSVKRSFALEIGEVRYRPLIDSDLRPPVDLNRALMDKYREAMKPHYRPPQVAFAVPQGACS